MWIVLYADLCVKRVSRPRVNSAPGSCVNGTVLSLLYSPFWPFHWQVSEDMASGEGDMDKLMNKMERLQNELDACNGWEVDRQMQVRL